METIIISSLIVALVILLCIVITRSKNFARTKETESSHSTELPSIIGPTKTGTTQYQLKNGNEAQHKNRSVSKADFEFVNAAKAPAVEQENAEIEGYQILDWEQEEEELQKYRAYESDGGFATGITFEELANFGKLLGQQARVSYEKGAALDMVSKLDGTELLDLLESHIGDVSKKIAALLDQSTNHSATNSLNDEKFKNELGAIDNL